MILNTQENRELLVETLCQTFGITKAKIMSKTREREPVMARAVGYKIAKEKFGMTLREISAIFPTGKNTMRHHTTIIHSLQSLNDLASVGDELVIGTTNEVLRRLDQTAKKGVRVIIEVHPDNLVLLGARLDKWGYEYEVIEDGVTLKIQNNG